MHLRERTDRFRSATACSSSPALPETGSDPQCVRVSGSYAGSGQFVVREPQQFANFHQRGFAEVLSGKKFLFADFGQIAQRVDIHRGQAVSASNRQFEIGHWSAQQMLHAGFLTS